MGNFVEVAKVSEIESGTGKMVEVEGKEIAIFNDEGEFYAIDNECPHIGAPLCEGELEDGKVVCPWHGSEFDLKSGEALSPPADEDVSCYKLEIEGDVIKIEV